MRGAGAQVPAGVWGEAPYEKGVRAMSAQGLLVNAVSEWERRRKWGVILENLPYALLPGLAAGAALALYSRLRPGISDATSLTIGVGGALLGVGILFALVWL